MYIFASNFLKTFWINFYFYFHRRRLRRIYPDKIFLPCFAHQVNLCVGDIFKSSSRFKEISEHAVNIIGYFNNSVHSYMISKLRDEQISIYNKCIMFIKPGDTRWNSNYQCFKNLLAWPNHYTGLKAINIVTPNLLVQNGIQRNSKVA